MTTTLHLCTLILVHLLPTLHLSNSIYSPPNCISPEPITITLVIPPLCHFSCDVLEMLYHIFVQCPWFTGICEEVYSALLHNMSVLLQATETPLSMDVILCITCTLFTNDLAIWLQALSHFYYSMIPPFPAMSVTRKS